MMRYYIHQFRNLHVNGLRGLGTGIPITLTLDTPYQQVGKPGKFRIIGAPPNAEIFWSSYKNGQATGELNASYGQRTEANGTAEIEWTPVAADIGNWTKEILIQDASGENYTAMVQFVVSEATPAATTTTTNSGVADVLKQGFYLGDTLIPYWMPAAAIGAWFFLKRR